MRKKYLSALLFGALLFASAGTFTSCKDYDDDIKNLQEQIDGKATLEELQSQLETMQADVTSAKTTAEEAKTIAEEALQKAEQALAGGGASEGISEEQLAQAIADAKAEIEAQIEKLHPAPYSFQDIGHLVRFFTKKGMRVLDPFGGVGSTAKACEIDGRVCTSIELSPKWHQLSIERLEKEVGEGTSKNHTFINGDSCEELLKLENESVDFVVTSPPYWGILNKLDQKVIKNRVKNNLETKYSEDEKDLGNVSDYEEFLDILVNKVFLECARVLRTGKYMALVVSDFRDKSDFISFHADLISRMNKHDITGGGYLNLQGIKILLQNHKSLLPYGYPFAYVENIHHQYILIFKKEAKRK